MCSYDILGGVHYRLPFINVGLSGVILPMARTNVDFIQTNVGIFMEDKQYV